MTIYCANHHVQHMPCRTDGSVCAKGFGFMVPVPACGAAGVCECPAENSSTTTARLDPCPSGWSRIDPMFAGPDCALPTTALKCLALFATLSTIVMFCCALFIARRLHEKSATATVTYRIMSLVIDTCACGSIWFITMVHTGAAYQRPIIWAMTALSMMRSVSVCCQAAQYFCDAQLGKIFALQPQELALWRGRIAVLFRNVAPVIADVAVVFAIIVLHKHDEDEEKKQFAVRTLFTVVGALFGLAATAIFASNHLGIRVLASLGHAPETAQLRRKIRGAMLGARFIGLGYGVLAVPFVSVGSLPQTRRVPGLCLAAIFGAVCALQVPWFVSIVRKIITKKKRRVTHSTKVHIGTARRISKIVEGTAAVASSNSNTTPLCRRGVSLAFLRAFLAQNGVGTRTTTGDVCARFIKPATARLRCAYFEMLARGAAAAGIADDEPPWTGESHYFLSHSWAYRFRELVDIIEAFEQQTKPTSTRYYWFDIFVMNQHSHEDMDNLLGNLQASVRSPGRMLLALDSWRDPTPLTRAWCLLEIFTAISTKADVIMGFSLAEESSFKEQLAQNQAEVEAALAAVDAERAEATVQADRDMIFEAIKHGTGFEGFNDTIRRALRESLQRVIINDKAV